jgi:hypothetical protein
MNKKYATPGIGVWVLTAVSAIIGAFGVLSLKNLTAVALLSNVGTFVLYGLTNVVAILAFAKEKSSIFKRLVIPIAGFGANVLMLGALVWISIIGGGDAQWEALFAISGTVIWFVIGLAYFAANSKSKPSPLLPFPGKEVPEDQNAKHSINQM